MKALKIFRSGKALANVMSVCIWLLAFACVVGLFYRRSQRFEVLGIAQGQVRQIAATCDGRLINVPVKLYQKVKEGDKIAVINAVLDNEVLQEQLETATAEVEQLQAQLVHTQNLLLTEAINLENQQVADQRRFFVDVENAKLRLLELEAQIEIEQLALDQINLSIKEFQTRAIDAPSGSPDADYYQLQILKSQPKTLAQKIETTKRQLAQARLDLQQAQQRLDDFLQRQPQTPPIDSALEVLRKSITVQQMRMKELLARRDPVIITAPIDGVVSQILRRPVRRTGEGVVRQMIRRSGEAVTTGDPILTISAEKPSEIIAYIQKEYTGRVQKGTEVQIIKNTEPAQIGTAKITSLGPIMEVMPQRIWLVPDIPDWGIPVLIEIPPGMQLFPGELVAVKGLQ
ncbi:MAG: HlyD family secretion protein [Planctomycetota bacterium]|jgi:multidrug resistance efflux pump